MTEEALLSAVFLQSEACGLPFRRHFPWNLILLAIFVSDRGDRCWVSGEGGGTEAGFEGQSLNRGHPVKESLWNRGIDPSSVRASHHLPSLSGVSPLPRLVFPVSCPWKIV